MKKEERDRLRHYGQTLCDFVSAQTVKDACLKHLDNVGNLYGFDGGFTKRMKDNLPDDMSIGGSNELLRNRKIGRIARRLGKNIVLRRIDELDLKRRLAKVGFDFSYEPGDDSLRYGFRNGTIILSWFSGAEKRTFPYFPKREGSRQAEIRLWEEEGVSLGEDILVDLREFWFNWVLVDLQSGDYFSGPPGHMMRNLRDLPGGLANLEALREFETFCEGLSSKQLMGLIVNLHIIDVWTNAFHALHGLTSRKPYNEVPNLEEFVRIYNLLPTKAKVVVTAEGLIEKPPMPSQDDYLEDFQKFEKVVKEHPSEDDWAACEASWLARRWEERIEKDLSYCLINFLKAEGARDLLRECGVCGRVFLVKTSWQRFCSSACQNRNKRWPREKMAEYQRQRRALKKMETEEEEIQRMMTEGGLTREKAIELIEYDKGL